MEKVVVVIGAGLIGQAIARRAKSPAVSRPE